MKDRAAANWQAGESETNVRGMESSAVLLPRAVPAPFDYLVPPGLELACGDFVRVPLQTGSVPGIVWGTASGEVDAGRMKPIAERLPLPPMPLESRRFLERASRYTITPLGLMLSLSFRPGWLRSPAAAAVQGLRRTEVPLPRMTAGREAVLAALAETGAAAIPAAELVRRSGVGPSVVNGLVQLGVLERVAMPKEIPATSSIERISLNSEQANAARILSEAVGRGSHRTFLLQGVTGSGKTEVYLEAVRETVRSGRQALVLLPEIALTEAFVRRLGERMGVAPAIWHSKLSSGARRKTWHAAVAGAAPIIAGARSALFLPYQRLGLIVVDEEHDSSYKQEDRVIYSARDMAVLRAACAGIPAILATATPSLESYVNVMRGRYERLSLPERFGRATLPEVQTIDLRTHRLGRRRWLTPRLLRAVEETMKAGGQSLLFLNRRGYAPLLVCHRCGHRIGCQHCDVALVAHRSRGALLCHHCGYQERVPSHCPDCGAPDSMSPCGPGVERLAEEAAARFPGARLTVLSSDAAVGGLALRNELDAVANGDVDIVVGTQIVAKGHHFPRLRLVCVVDADLCLASGDFRAGERTFQTIRQVTGRAGRGGGESLALLQTADPDHPVIRAIIGGDEERFLSELASSRKAAAAPPFGRYVAAIVSSRDRDAARQTARALGKQAAMLECRGIRLLGPVPAPFARLRDHWRWRFLAVAPRSLAVQRHLADWRESVHAPRGVRIALDVDPQSFL